MIIYHQIYPSSHKCFIFENCLLSKIYNFSTSKQCIQANQQSLNNYNNKMNETFLNNLADFKDVRLSSRNQLLDIQNRSRDSFHSRGSLDLDIQNQSNEKLLKIFKQLREQLKQSQKNTDKYRLKLNQKQIESQRIRHSQRQFITSNHQLKNQMEHIRTTNADLKAKLDLLKGLTKNAHQSQEESEFLKMTISNMKVQITNLEAEKNKLLEISILEKVQMEEKIRRLQAKKSNDVQYVQQMELQASRLKEKCLKLENQLRKMQIKYDEEVYNKQWANDNFERENLQDQLKQTEAQNQEILIKHKKEKEKRNLLEKRVLELEQTTGLWVVKAETFQVENKALQKKCKAAQKKLQQIKDQSSKKLSDNLALQEKFAKSTAIAEELIARVKRELYGDLVALAKSCQFRLNKLKQQKEGFFKSQDPADSLRKSTIQIRLRSKSKNNFKIEKDNDRQTQQKPTPINLQEKFECTIPRRETQSPNENILTMCGTKMDRSENVLCQIENIEARIKKQRDQMEKKIRQKMLYRKLEVANSPQKHKLRQDYFKLLEN